VWTRARNLFERWLFAPLAGRDVLARARRLTQYLYALLRDLLGGQLNLRASGLVYATVLALIPLLAFSFAILRAFGAHRELQPLIFEFFRPMGPAADELTQRVMDFADRVRGGLVGSVGLGLLIWTLLGALKKVEDSLNFVWRVEVPRSFMRRIAEYLVLLVVAPLLLGALIGMARAPDLGSTRLIAASISLAPYLLVGGVFAAIYGLVPNTRVRVMPALWGGLAAGVVWTAVGHVFTSFVIFSARLTIVYAGFAIFVAVLIWTYLSWLILLMGAQLSFYLQNPSYLALGLREAQLSNAATEQLALSIMYLVAQSHLAANSSPPGADSGDPRSRAPASTRWSVNALAAHLHVPGIALSRLCDALEAAGLLVSTEHETLVPGRDAGHIQLREILNVARNFGTVSAEHHLNTPAAVLGIRRAFDEGWERSVAARDLESLVLATSYSPAMVISAINSEPQRIAP